MRGKMRKVLENGVIIFMLSVALCSSCGVKTEKEEREEIEQAVITEKEWGNAPDFTLVDLEGNNLTLSDFKRKVIILNFWATWCPPCRMEIPDFIELYEKYGDEGLRIIGVNLDGGDRSSVKKFSEKYKINYPVVFGDVNVTQDYGGIRAIPTTFIIDREGNIREKYVGYQRKAIFEEALKKLLEIP